MPLKHATFFAISKFKALLGSKEYIVYVDHHSGVYLYLKNIVYAKYWCICDSFLIMICTDIAWWGCKWIMLVLSFLHTVIDLSFFFVPSWKRFSKFCLLEFGIMLKVISKLDGGRLGTCFKQNKIASSFRRKLPFIWNWKSLLELC